MIRTREYDDSALMSEIAELKEQIEADSIAIEEMAKHAEKNLAAIRDITDSLSEQKEYTHDIGVQIYRNVQASLIDELAKQTADREEHCKIMQEKLEQIPTTPVKQETSGLLIVTFLISLGNLCLLLWICYLNGYLGI